MNKKYVLFGATGLFILIGLIATDSEEKEITSLKRQGYGGVTDEYHINARYDNEEYIFDIPVSPKELPTEELNGYFDLAFEKILTDMPGDNESLDCVRDDLVFQSMISEYGITADYYLDDYTYLSSFGEVEKEKIPKEGATCNITIVLSYESPNKGLNKIAEYTVPIVLYPPVYDEKEKVVNAVNTAILNADKDQAEADYLKLPQEISDKKICFYEKEESKFPAVIMVILAIGLGIYYKNVTLAKNQDKKKEAQMSLDYSEVVTKLSLLMGAGMSGARAFEKMAEDYKQSLTSNKTVVRYAYEEIAAASNRLKTGVSEEVVYSDFGRRCRLHSYIKLGSLMTQNVKKGGDGFIDILKNEAADSFIERKAIARKHGEEAGTKLLLPMMLQLMVVLVVIIVPAFMSFG